MNIEIIENRRLWEVDHRVEATTSGMTIFMNGKSETFDLSHLAEDGEYLLEDCMELEYNPVQSIKKDGDKVTVSVFYDNPYEYREEWVCPFEKKGKVVKAVPTKDNNLEMAKEAQLPFITMGFDKELEEGHFLSSTLGIEVDCRRSDKKNDKQNVEGLISNMTRNSKATVNYVGYSEIKTGVTKTQLEELVAEMEDHVLGLYEKKWMKQSEIQSATTIQEVKSISW